MAEEQNQSGVKKFYRSNKNRILFGVCGGLGEYFNIDPVIIRIIFVALTLGGGWGIIIYVILGIIAPSRPEGDIMEPSQEQQLHVPASKWLGVAIVALGAWILFRHLAPNFFTWEIFWAAILVVVGFLILSGKRGYGKFASEPQKEKWSFPGWGRFFLGALVIIFGLGLLAANFGWTAGINTEILTIFWPVLVIMFGLMILLPGSSFRKIAVAILALATIGLLLASFLIPGKTQELENYNFEIPAEQVAQQAEVFLSGGAAEIKISGGTEFLVSGNLESNVVALQSESNTENGTQKVKIQMKEQGRINFFPSNFKNNLDVKLSENIPLALKLDSGASKTEVDLSNLKISGLEINTGASDLKLTLGNEILNGTNVDVNAGASSIKIILPKEIGVRVEMKGGLSSIDFPESQKTGENSYESNNYASSTKQINISLETGASSVSLSWR